jgi:hypothetical protein
LIKKKNINFRIQFFFKKIKCLEIFFFLPEGPSKTSKTTKGRTTSGESSAFFKKYPSLKKKFFKIKYNLNYLYFLRKIIITKIFHFLLDLYFILRILNFTIFSNF